MLRSRRGARLTAGSNVKYKEYSPHTTLQDHVNCFWIMEREYTPVGQPNSRTELAEPVF